ncbi:MAG: class I SAM-dependent methyltransferase [Dehalococcoidia bacterium]
MEAEYEYHGLKAETWDLLRGDYSTWPDRPFYRAVIERQGGRALDVGCGTGRLLLDYVGAGLDVDGVDNSPEMLALCRDKAAAHAIDVDGRLFEQRMESLELRRLYATICVPSSSFQLLTSEDAAAAAMRRFYQHLQPGGVLVMPFMSKLWPGESAPAHLQWSDWFPFGERTRPEDGARVRRWVRTMYDLDQQLEHQENRYEVLAGDAIVVTETHAQSPATRWYTQEQALTLYMVAGFKKLRMTRAFTEEAATAEDPTFCVFGTRP